MYCPKCAALAPDDAKFCRTCGTDLKTVALALNGQLVPATELNQHQGEKLTEDWLKQRNKGKSQIIQGAILLGMSLLFGLVGALASKNDFPWFLVWTVFFGWLAVWGIIAITSGVGGMIESKSGLRQQDSLASAAAVSLPAPQASVPDTSRIVSDPLAASAAPVPVSVTEDTTESLNKFHPTI